MSELLKQLFEGIEGIKEAVEAIAPGLKDVVPEVGDELKRLGKHGQTEMAAALFGGNAFVVYGPGQHTPARDDQHREQGIER